MPLSSRLLEEAMSGQYLNNDFSLPCPPGLEIPEQQHYTITANTLKVSLPWAAGRCGAGQGVTGEPASPILLVLGALPWDVPGDAAWLWDN